MSFSDDEFLWMNGFLGKDNPEQLLNTLVFVLGLSCALRSGKEHYQLRSFGFNSQFSWHVDCDGNRFFTYKEDLGMKTNKGGIETQKDKSKSCECVSKFEPKQVPSSNLVLILL